jgi:hypothetical protein
MFATFIYEKAAERLLRHFIGTDENEGIRQALNMVRGELERSRASMRPQTAVLKASDLALLLKICRRSDLVVELRNCNVSVTLDSSASATIV